MSRRPFSAIAVSLAVATVIASGLIGPVEASQSGSSGKGRHGSDPGLLGTEARGVSALANFKAQGPNLIRLLAGAFDPLAGPAPRGAAIPHRAEASLSPDTAQYWLAQVRDFRFPQATRAIDAAGGSIAGVMPDTTYMVRATPRQAADIRSSSAIRWVGYFQPAWRVPVAAGGRKALLDLRGPQTYKVYAFRKGADAASVGRALAAIRGVTMVRDGGTVFEVRATAAQVPSMAAIPAVQWIGIKPRGALLNANARWVNDTGIRDVYAATAPGRLSGAGQTAAVADTGINYTYDLNNRAHVSFSDCDVNGVCKEAIYTQVQAGSDPANINNISNNNTGHRKMVAYFDLGATGPNMFDDSSHGSHTAGSVDGDQPPYDTWTGDDGLAPAANHVHQNIADSGGGLGGLPADDYDLWRQSYRPRNPGSVSETSGVNGNPADYISPNYVPLEDARTHNNSYGLIAPVIDDGSAVLLDSFVWDHEDMTVVVSAGNMGPDPFSIGSPSTAKNELSSGASGNGRQPMVSIDSMAIFSSHGPTADGRFGVDVATPGQIVVSVKGGTTADHHTAQGTSMSGPILTGLATLVRQYFYDGYAQAGGDGFAAGSPSPSRQHNPSAALVKAALANGAVRMRGWYTGDDGTQRVTDGQWPSAGQGFGRVSLDNSLYFSNDPTNNWYADVYRGDTANPDVNLRPFPVSMATATRTFSIPVAAGQPLDVTLAWTDAPDLLPAGSTALINNLDLTVTGPSGTFVGNNMNSRANPSVAVAETLNAPGPADLVNLTERVRIAAPAAGTYTITVTAEPIIDGNQGFALAASGSIGPSFVPGPALQVDQPGNPVIANVSIAPVSADTAKITFDTSEPTSANAVLTDDGNTVTFIDSYNLGSGALPGAPAGDTGYYGLGDAAVETSADYGNKPVVGMKHEILLTGLNAGATYPITLSATDLASNTVTQGSSHTSPSSVFQANSVDIAQCSAASPGPPPSPSQCAWNTGTQLYASGGELLGAWMFRLPQSFNPSSIVSAAVETMSSHNWVVPYTQDPQLSVDLLDESVEATWGTAAHTYDTIDVAAADARAYPETTHKIGAYQRYAFTFRCNELQALKDTLTSNRQAAFRYESSNGGFFAMDFGFNRRSRGADMRPRLVLFTGTANPYGEACSPSTPPPTITDIGIHNGLAANSVTVSWRTDVASDSLVLFREQGAVDWIQVGTLARSTKVHQVQVFGLDSTKEYEFAVRSAACNGATTTDTNGGAGYDFFRDPPPVIPTTDYFLHGLPDDQVVKQTRLIGEQPPPQNLTFDQTAPAMTDPPVTQTTTGVANESFVGNPLTAFWTGPFSGQIQGDVPFSWYWSAGTPGDKVVSVSLFADPDWAGGPVQPDRIIGHGLITLTGLTAAPSLETGSIPVDGTVVGELLVQVASSDLTEEDLTVHYNSTVTPSKFGIPTMPAPPTEPLPLTGPVPPPSAGAVGLNPPPTETGPASAADIAAGTGACDIPIRPADVSVTKTDSPDPVHIGQTLTYTITVTNTGPGAATGVTATDQLPKNAGFGSASTTKGTCTIKPQKRLVTCALGTLASGETVTITITMKPTRKGTITNVVTVQSASPPDPNTANNRATADTVVLP